LLAAAYYYSSYYYHHPADLLVKYKTLTGGEVRGVLEGRVPQRQPGDKLPPS